MSELPATYDVPDRHKRILDERRKSVERGEIEYIDREEAKRQIRSQVK